MIGNGHLTVLDLLEVKPSTFTPEDVAALEEMARETLPEYEKRMATHVGAQKYERELTRTLAELDGLHSQAAQEARHMLLASADEVIAMTSSCDVTALAARLRPHRIKSSCWRMQRTCCSSSAFRLGGFKPWKPC